VSLSRRTAVLVGSGVAAVALVGGIVWLASARQGGSEAVLGGELLVAGTSLEPQGHLFGERVTARLDIVYDPEHVRADRIAARPRFAPYTVVGRRESRASFGNVARIRQTYLLDCLRARCLAPKRGFFEFPRVGVGYVTTLGPGTQAASAEWPRLQVASRTGADELEGLRVRADVRDLPAVTYRVRPALITGVGYALALMLALVGAVLFARALSVPELLAGAIGRRRALSPLERALALVRRATARGELDGSRRALERLAKELRRTEEADLAQAAARLAWRRDQPSGTTVDPLSTEVERVISEDGQ
jgi:hypothetical protein